MDLLVIGGFVFTYFFVTSDKYVEGAGLDNTSKFEFK